MSWAEHHSESERLAAEAEVALRSGDDVRARSLYADAAQAEARALCDLDPGKTRTLGISAVSAVALWYKARNYPEAERLAHHWLSTQKLPPFATEQLQGLLQAIWSELVREQAGIRFVPGEVLVSVKGGEVVAGGAPLDLVVQKVEGVQALFYRTAEFLKGLPHRKRGPASAEVQEICRPWLFQTAPGSYQFAVAIQEPAQRDLFAPPKPSTHEISAAFLRILRASVDDPDNALPQIVPDAEYRGTFLRLARSLAPTGTTFSELEVSSPTETKPVTLVPTSRKAIGDAIRRQFPRPTADDAAQEETLRGILRALHLDDDWLEVAVENEHIRIFEAGETVDDVVGPMVNKKVVVQAVKKPNGRYVLRDIQADE